MQFKPFNLEAAKRGDPICTRDGRKVRFIAHIPECAESHRVVAYIEGGQCIFSFFNCGSLFEHGVSDNDLFMAPLCEVEGKPVYPGDKLWSRTHSEWVMVTDTRDTEFILGANCSWDKPKVKKVGWTNLYRTRKSGWVRCKFVHRTEQDALLAASGGDVLATVRIEWEE